MTEQAKMSIASRLVAAMGEIDAVTKEGKNQAQGYSYVRAADVANEVRKVLVKHGIAFGFDVIEEERWSHDRMSREGVIIGVMNYVRIVADVIFEDSLTGELRISKARGWGQDVGEKAIYKAMTGALKYALRMNFIIPDESDPENEERTTPEQAMARPQVAEGQKPWGGSATSHNAQEPPRSPKGAQPVTAAPKSSPGSSQVRPDPIPDAGNFNLVGELLECVIKGSTAKTTKPGKPYLTVTWNGRIDGLNYGFCFHQSLHDAIKGATGKPCIVKISKKMSEDGKSVHTLYIEDVLYVDGVDYENGKPKPKTLSEELLSPFPAEESHAG